MPAVSVAEIDPIVLGVELPVQLGVQERDVVALEVIVGIGLPVAREVVLAPTGPTSCARPGSRSVSAKKPARSSSSGRRVGVEVHEHVAAPGRDAVRRAARTRRRRAPRRSRARRATVRRASTPIRGTDTRDSGRRRSRRRRGGPHGGGTRCGSRGVRRRAAYHHQRPPRIRTCDVRARRRDLGFAANQSHSFAKMLVALALVARRRDVPLGGKCRRRFGHVRQPTGTSRPVRRVGCVRDDAFS